MHLGKSAAQNLRGLEVSGYILENQHLGFRDFVFVLERVSKKNNKGVFLGEGNPQRKGGLWRPEVGIKHFAKPEHHDNMVLSMFGKRKSPCTRVESIRMHVRTFWNS